MIFFRSVVGKLWFTILLLVSFVLLILTVLLLEFLENFHVQQVEDELLFTANRIVEIINTNEEPIDALEISAQLLGNERKIMIAQEDREIFSSTSESTQWALNLNDIKKDENLSSIFEDGTVVTKELAVSSSDSKEHQPFLIVGVPLSKGKETNEVVFVIETLDSTKNTVESTTKLIILSAGVAIILTTIFAFFLSTRITAPLRKMREAAFEVARGKFDTKVPTISSDEIGELAIAFNQMAKQLKFNMNALGQEKENLASILSSMADGVITFNIDQTILATNPPADQFLHYWYTEEKDGQEKAEAPYELIELFKQSVENEEEKIGEIKFGDHYWVIIVSPLYNNENIRGAVAVLRDMTEERRLEKMKNDFIANVSHELRTPISMLQGYSEAIVDNIAESNEEKQELAKIIYDESLRMGRLVNELLDLARMEAGHIHLNMEEVHIESYLNRIKAKFQGIAKENNIKLSTKLEDVSSYWNFDPDRIEQVLTNLIDNALRHTPEGGSILIEQKIDKLNNLIISVKDSGTGIPAKDLPFVFERFYKADKARTRSNSGTGLGLAIVQHIVKAHHGDVMVESLESVGTTFIIKIPQTMV